MSTNAQNWARTIPLSSTRDRALLMSLSNFFNDSLGYAYPSVETLAKTLSATKRTTQRALRSLEKLGVIKTKAFYVEGKNGRKGTRYVLVGYEKDRDYRHAPIAKVQCRPRKRLGDTSNSLGDTLGGLGDTSGSLGDTSKGLGDTLQTSLGDSFRGLGDTFFKGSLGDKLSPKVSPMNLPLFVDREGIERTVTESVLSINKHTLCTKTSLEFLRRAYMGGLGDTSGSLSEYLQIGFGCQFVTLTIKGLITNLSINNYRTKEKERRYLKIPPKEKETDEFETWDPSLWERDESNDESALFEFESLQAWDALAKDYDEDTSGVTPATIAKLYNSHPVSKVCGRILKLTEARKGHVNARIKDARKTAHLKTDEEISDWFSKLFDTVVASDFLTGKTPHKFVASFDFIFNESGFTKIVEGKYNKSMSPKTRFKGYREPERTWDKDYYMEGLEAFQKPAKQEIAK